MLNMLEKAIIDNILLPIVVVVGSTILMLVKHYIKKITDSIVSNNELKSLNSIISIQNNLLTEINTIVQAAVYTNMTLVEKIKAGGKKLDESEIVMLQDTAKQLVYKALPSSLTEDDGSMLNIIGGRDKLESIIVSSIEQSVIDAKSKISLFSK